MNHPLTPHQKRLLIEIMWAITDISDDNWVNLEDNEKLMNGMWKEIQGRLFSYFNKES